jgi:hypothetical protein
MPVKKWTSVRAKLESFNLQEQLAHMSISSNNTHVYIQSISWWTLGIVMFIHSYTNLYDSFFVGTRVLHLNVQGWLKKKSHYLRHWSHWNFKCCWYIWQRTVEFVVMWFEARAQKEHSCGRSTWWSTSVLTWLSEELHAFGGHRKCWQLISIDSMWKCMEMTWCPGNRLPNGA